MSRDPVKPSARARRLQGLLRIATLRIDAQWLVVQQQREALARCEHELAAQQRQLDTCLAVAADCRTDRAQAQTGTFSANRLPDFELAQRRLDQRARKQGEATDVARHHVLEAHKAEEAALAAWRALRARRDTLEDLRQRAQREAAVQDEIVQEALRDDQPGRPCRNKVIG